jgi:hypothetical protein
LKSALNDFNVYAYARRVGRSSAAVLATIEYSEPCYAAQFSPDGRS